jgi:hypothetical protein
VKGYLAVKRDIKKFCVYATWVRGYYEIYSFCSAASNKLALLQANLHKLAVLDTALHCLE